ncbi:hypothetical protein D3C71_525990 [compost metagenome]
MSQYLHNNQLINQQASLTQVPGVLDLGPGAQLSIEKEFYNGFRSPVTLVDRSGMPLVIQPMNVKALNQFIVRYTIKYRVGVNIDVERLSNATSEGMRALRDAVLSGSVRQRMGQCYAQVDYGVNENDVVSSGGSLYLVNLDVVVSTMQGGYVPHHPFSAEGVRNRLVATNETINTAGTVGYAIQIVDNEDVFGPRYININKEIFLVQPAKDPGRNSGVYRTSTAPVSQKGGVGAPRSDYFTFGEAEEFLGLFKSYEDAWVLGDIAAERKRELEELAQHLKETQHRQKLEALEREREFEEWKRDIEQRRVTEESDRKSQEHRWKLEEARINEASARLKEEQTRVEHLRNIAALERKDHYEERSYVRKDSSEFLKWVPAIAAGFAAIFLAFK